MMTRGPLPSSVYWRRRLLALTVALILVVAIAKVLGHGSPGSSSDAAQLTGSGSSTGASTSTGTSPSTSTSPARRSQPVTPTAPTTTAVTTPPATTVPAVPTGPCSPADVVVTPQVADASAATAVTVTLHLQTRTEPACFWRVTPWTMQVRIASHDAHVWSTADCRRAITTQQVTLYRQTPTDVTLTWYGHRSDGACSSHTPWADPGRYSVTATALGGEPVTSTFTLGQPTVVVTVTPSPTATATASAGTHTSTGASGTPSGTPSDTASAPQHSGGSTPHGD